MTHFLVVSFISSPFAFWLTGRIYPDNRKLQLFWFFVVRVVLMVIVYLHQSNI